MKKIDEKLSGQHNLGNISLALAHQLSTCPCIETLLVEKAFLKNVQIKTPLKFPWTQAFDILELIGPSKGLDVPFQF